MQIIFIFCFYWLVWTTTGLNLEHREDIFVQLKRSHYGKGNTLVTSMYFQILGLLCVIALHYVAPLLVTKQQNVFVEAKTSSVTFKVKECEDIVFHLVMSLPNGPTLHYECILRGYLGTRGFIRLRGRILVERKPASKKHCERYRPYWASWENGVVSTGTGWTVGQGLLMEYRTEFIELHLLWILIRFWVYKETRYIFDDQNAAYLRRTARSLFKGQTSSVVVITRSKLRCAAACREEPRCAAISYTRDTHRCQLVGPLKSNIKVASEELMLVTKRY